MTRRMGLSKSRITLFEQCPKRLWLSVHRPDLAEQNAGIRAAFADGHRVGDLACSLYPDGVMIGAGRRPSAVDHCALAPAVDEACEAEQREWLGRAANQFVNSLRPRLARLDR